MRSRLRRGPEISLFHTFVPPPYGGSNQFMLALKGELERRGISVGTNTVGRRTKACLLNAFLFDAEYLRRARRDGVRVVHRVDGPVALYRGYDDGTDAQIQALNDEFADATVFQSRYSLEASRKLGLDLREPLVIPNAVDERIFRPPPRREPPRGRRIRLITTSWSDNQNKGAETNRAIEGLLDWKRYEWMFVGRTRTTFERIRTLPPVGSSELAKLLRAHDVYVTASVNDPCSNALLEALACGLPALYVRSGGHPELVGAGGLGFDTPEEVPELLDRLVEEYEERAASIALVPLAAVADRYLDAMRIT